MSEPVAAGNEQPSPLQTARMLALATVIGIVGAIAASILLWLVEHGQRLIFADLPSAVGLAATPWWWIVLLLLVGTGVVLIARRMNGAAGEGPLTGFHFNNPLPKIPSILVAALGTLIFGFALGPEAPLIVLGTGVGGLLTRRADPKVQAAAMLLGGAAAIGAVFGNPFVTGFMMLEFAALGMLPAVLVLPAFAALASGYLVQIGIWAIPGFGVHPLAVPGLAPANDVEVGGLVAAFAVAAVAGIVAVLTREGGMAVDRIWRRRPNATIIGSALLIGLVVSVTYGILGIPFDQVLFSGQSGMPGLIAQTSVATVLTVLVAKAVAYALSLGGGFRGGPIFPATFLGVAVAVLVSLLVPEVGLAGLAAAGIAAAAAAIIKLPATSALLAALLVTGTAVAPYAIIGGAVGILVRLVADRAYSAASRTTA